MQTCWLGSSGFDYAKRSAVLPGLKVPLENEVSRNGFTEKIVHHPLFHFSLDSINGNAIRNVVP